MSSLSRNALKYVYFRTGVAAAIILLLGSTSLLHAQQVDLTEDGRVGRIDFAAADLPPANVEVDLSEEIFGDLFGLGEAAVAGAFESLSQSNEAEGTAVTALATEKLAAAQEIFRLAKDVVREVRVQVYESFPEGADNAADLSSRFDQQLRDGGWDNVIKVHDGNDFVQVSFLRVEGSILGVFAVVAEGDRNVVLANLVCDVSPENVKKLSAAVTKIGLEHGMLKKLEHELQHLR